MTESVRRLRAMMPNSLAIGFCHRLIVRRLLVSSDTSLCFTYQHSFSCYFDYSVFFTVGFNSSYSPIRTYFSMALAPLFYLIQSYLNVAT